MNNSNSVLSISAIKNQIATIFPTVIIGIFISLSGAGITVLVARLTGNPIWFLAKDPAEILWFQPYIGMLSNWGVLLWMASATICLFSSSIMEKYHVDYQSIKFIFASGVLSFTLAIDDLFMLHDRVLPRLAHIPEDFFYILYLIILLTYLVYFRREIFQRDYLLLAIAFFLFGFSRRIIVNIEFLNQFMTTGDMLKYFGIVFWLIFFYRISFQEITNLIKLNR